MKMSFLIVVLSASSLAFAAGTKKNASEHREHEAHQHGSATLGIAFEGLTGSVEFKAAAEGILGFEHKAQSEKDKKTLKNLTEKFENEIGKMIAFEKDLKCVISKDSIELISEGHHGDFVANYKVQCEKSPEGASLRLDFSSLKRIKDLDVTILIGAIQKSLELKGKPFKVDLK